MLGRVWEAAPREKRGTPGRISRVILSAAKHPFLLSLCAACGDAGMDASASPQNDREREGLRMRERGAGAAQLRFFRAWFGAPGSSRPTKPDCRVS